MTDNKPSEFKPVEWVNKHPFDGKIKYFSEEDSKNAIFKGEPLVSKR